MFRSTTARERFDLGDAVTGRFAVLGRYGLIAEIGKQAGQHIANE